MSFKPLIFIFLILFSNVASGAMYQSGSFDPVRENRDSWTCVDVAINYSRANEDWGVVTVAGNPKFTGVSHMLNWQVIDGVLVLKDCSQPGISLSWDIPQDTDTRHGYEYDYTYFHFWQRDETPLRNYRLLKDNLDEYYGELGA